VLASLSIRNFVLIEDATLEFGPGLTALTGETGAGKTLLTKALGLLMGERAEEGFIGAAADEALIQAVFELDPQQALELPEDLRTLAGIEGPGELIVTRRLGRAGRNRCYLNDSSVTLAAMATVAGRLLSFAGQHEYRRLLDPGYQLAVLDQWAGAEVLRLAAEYRTAYLWAKDCSQALADSLRARNERLREIDLLRFQVGELAAARLSAEDEEALQAEQRVLSRAEEIQRDLSLAAELLKAEGDATDASGLVGQAATLAAGLTAVDPQVAAMAQTLREAHYSLTELSRDLHRYVDHVTVDPARLSVVDERLRLYTDLARKYGGTTSAAVAYLASADARLSALEKGEEDLARLDEEANVSRARALELAASLTEARRRALPLLEAAVAAQLAGLGMTSAVMTAALDTRSGWEGLRETGADSVEFLLAANPGMPPRSLARTASGGELSRVLLGLRCALADVGGDETLIFDEIDAGIGGRTAVAVALKLHELAERSQVVVVTHLAQVAALAGRHYVIRKTSDPAGTVTHLAPLEGDAVVEELCRMMGGRVDDIEAMAHAKELRDRALGGLLD
jgi:DNA repair protein RecN (Recombination protein N)